MHKSLHNRKKIRLSIYIYFYFIMIAQAQLYNNSQIKILEGTSLSVFFDFKNASKGEFINDGEVYVFNHLTNDGKIDFVSSSSGTTYFKGDHEQIIDGEIPSKTVVTNFNNVVFDSKAISSQFLLATDITISGKAYFKKGIVDGDSYSSLVIFNNDGSHINTSNESFVDGRVKKIGYSSFEYPIGDKQYYRPSVLTSSNDELNSHTSRYFFENSSLQHPHSQKQDNIKLIDDKEYWEISKNNANVSMILTLTLNRATTPDFIYNSQPNTTIQIVRWDESSEKWVTEGGVSDLDQNIVTTEISDYGIFTLARVIEKEDDEFIIYNAISPNGDGKNDFFFIKGIKKYPENNVAIYNRWGVLVYQTNGYNESDRVFRGYSDGRSTVNYGAGLPTGTYFYTLKYNTGTTSKQKAGYLYINFE